ncbi:uncharacterized protein LOC141680108 [Apium graveolens]|uniref:uncharacterized protein LOC141680108 n=1 Tax=Apium graveolens TaxID=4045 RepID=UPI003D796B3E
MEYLELTRKDHTRLKRFYGRVPITLKIWTESWFREHGMRSIFEINLGEISSGREHWTPGMQVFKDCLASCSLDRVRTVGDNFTWTNKCIINPVFKCLDRMVANGVWFNLFTEGNVFVKPRGLMDHKALLFEEPMQLQKISKPFQFFNYMVDVPGFHATVDKAWSLICSGSCYAKFASKLKETKVLLCQLNRAHGNVSSNVLTVRANLADLQVTMLNNEDPSLLSLEKDLINVLNLALAEEESLYLQKSRIKWMGLRDVVHYFKNLLGPEVTDTAIDLESVDCKVIMETQASLLSAAVNDALIFNTLKKMKKNKAPGPDGVNVEFFLATWNTIGPDFCASIKSFFDTGFLPSGMNSTLISLIPKVDSPTRMADFRPISLCTVMYKCISKIIASILKLIMPTVSDIAQSAFIPGRSNSDNILLAQELFRGYDRETGTPKCALKIDLHKAFDSLNWDFILAALTRFHFPEIVIKWIKACLCTTKFSVKLNGIIHGYFKGTNGIRQGEPFSPYIFALCMQVLSGLLNSVPSGFRYHWRCKEMGPDLLLWNGIDAAKAKTWDIWDSIHFKAEMVPWHTGVWHKLRVNRYAHHQWISCHGRLHTLARLHRFGLVESQQCFLCICARETDSHIFLNCSYSNWILRNLMSLLDIGIHGESSNSFITYLIDLPDKTKSIMALCCAQIFCYHIWRERNARAHDSGFLVQGSC